MSRLLPTHGGDFSFLRCCNDSNYGTLLSTCFVAAAQDEEILQLVQWKLDPILHLQTELWPIPQSFQLSHMEKAIGKDLR